jgi:20S proteasome alpha/beta subunit
VTIIAGFKGWDGIVLCSDTQETIEHSKRRVSKLRIEPSDGKSEMCVAFCGAGSDGPFIDKIISLAWKDAQAATSLDSACEEIEKSIKKTYKEYGQIYQRGFCPEAELIYGVKMNRESKLFHASGPLVNEKIYYAAGIGHYMADFISMRMFEEHMDIRQLEIIAAYILFQTKEHVDGCGGDSEIAIIRNKGGSGRIERPFVDYITETLSASDTELARALMLCADFGLSKSEFLKQLRATVTMLAIHRGNGIDKIKEDRKWARFSTCPGFVEVDDLGVKKPERGLRLSKKIAASMFKGER